jgi:hypothetical protein
MAAITDTRKLMLHCTRVNVDYMRLPAGLAEGYQNIAQLYKSLAKQSYECASSWVRDDPCPEHEPAVDAFWWGVVAWAEAFGLSVGVDTEDWGQVFVAPHAVFASYLRENGMAELLPFVSGPPVDVILRMDVLWMERVIKLTGKWGLWHHMKDLPALNEARRLGGDLKIPGSPTRQAYLESDLKFFEALFKPFAFKTATRQHLKSWLAEARRAL